MNCFLIGCWCALWVCFIFNCVCKRKEKKFKKTISENESGNEKRKKKKIYLFQLSTFNFQLLFINCYFKSLFGLFLFFELINNLLLLLNQDIQKLRICLFAFFFIFFFPTFILKLVWFNISTIYLTINNILPARPPPSLSSSSTPY